MVGISNDRRAANTGQAGALLPGGSGATTFTRKRQHAVEITDAEYVRTVRDPSLYLAVVDRRSGGFQGSALVTYEINWQTRIDLGYQESDFRTPEHDRLFTNGRTAFLKVSYAFQL